MTKQILMLLIGFAICVPIARGADGFSGTIKGVPTVESIAAGPVKIDGLTKIDHAKRKHWYSPTRQKQFHYKTKEAIPRELVTNRKIANMPDLRPDKEQHPWKSKEAWADRRDASCARCNKYSGAIGIVSTVGMWAIGAATKARVL